MTRLRPNHGAHQEDHPHHLPKDFKELGELAQLLFEWPIRQAPRLALPLCILFAAIVQAGVILLFSISYTTPSDTQPDSPQIYFLPPDSAAARQIAPWLAANNPAVFSPQYDTRDALPAPPPLRYRPSYEDPPPPLHPLPADTASPIVPPLFPKMADIMMHPSRSPAMASAPPSKGKPIVSTTVIHWQDELTNRVLIEQTNGTSLPPQALTPSAQATLYNVEISPEGLPLHCIQLDSSGDPATDQAGSVWIHSQRFEPAPQSSWGRVLILWGAPQTTNNPQA